MAINNEVSQSSNINTMYVASKKKTKINNDAKCTQICNTQNNVNTQLQPPEELEMVQQGGAKKKTAYFYGTIIAQICIILYTLVIICFCLSGEFILFTWHPLLMATGWFMLMTQGILILSREEFLTRNKPHKLRVKLHWILQSVGAVMTTTGFLVIVWNKFNLNKHHFQTWHALLGLAAFICLALTLCTGASTLYSSVLKSYYSPKWNKFIHVSFGVLTYFIGGLSLLLTVYTKWFNRKSDDSTILFIYGIICVLNVTTLTLLKPLKYLWNRVQNF